MDRLARLPGRIVVLRHLNTHTYLTCKRGSGFIAMLCLYNTSAGTTLFLHSSANGISVLTSKTLCFSHTLSLPPRSIVPSSELQPRVFTNTTVNLRLAIFTANITFESTQPQHALSHSLPCVAIRGTRVPHTRTSSCFAPELHSFCLKVARDLTQQGNRVPWS